MHPNDARNTKPLTVHYSVSALKQNTESGWAPIEIRVVDRVSGLSIMHLEVGHADFMMAIAGLARLDGTAMIWPDNVPMLGMKPEHRTVWIDVGSDAYGNEAGNRAVEIAERENPGWFCQACTSQGNHRDNQRRVRLVRWVPTTEAEDGE